ncbi:MAG: PAS domain-containing protein [Bacteroidota bacterium]
MRSNEAFINAILNNSPIVFGAIDLENEKWIWRSTVTDSGDSFTGYTKAEMEAFEKNEIEIIVHPDDQKRFMNDIDKLKKSSLDEPVESVIRIKRSNESFVWVRVLHKTYEWDCEKKPLKAALVCEDITERVAVQERLKDTLRRLEEISHKNSHEIKAPVESILRIVSLIVRQNNIGTHNKLLIEHLYKSVQKLESIIVSINNLK